MSPCAYACAHKSRSITLRAQLAPSSNGVDDQPCSRDVLQLSRSPQSSSMGQLSIQRSRKQSDIPGCSLGIFGYIESGKRWNRSYSGREQRRGDGEGGQTGVGGTVSNPAPPVSEPEPEPENDVAERHRINRLISPRTGSSHRHNNLPSRSSHSRRSMSECFKHSHFLQQCRRQPHHSGRSSTGKLSAL